MDDTQLIHSQEPELPVGAEDEGRGTRSRAQTRKSKVVPAGRGAPLRIYVFCALLPQ